jgi:hypothetical protein
MRGSPIRPAPIHARIVCQAGRKRLHNPSMRKRPLARARSTRGRKSAAAVVIGFSQSTCLPASRQSRIWPAWKGWGVAMYTMSTSASATNPAYDTECRTAPWADANAFALAASREATDTKEHPSTCRRPSANFAAILPGPRIPQRSADGFVMAVP